MFYYLLVTLSVFREKKGNQELGWRHSINMTQCLMHRSVTEQLWLQLWDFIITEDCVQNSTRELKLELKISLRLKLLQRCESFLKHKDCWRPAVCASRPLILLYLWTPEDSDEASILPSCFLCDYLLIYSHRRVLIIKFQNNMLIWTVFSG